MKLVQNLCLLLSGAKYIIRLDDACDTQNHAKWSEIERILQLNNIKPIVAVIPCNEDHDLFYNPSNPNFWSLVKRWQDSGWVIGQHGFKHQRHSIKKKEVMVPLHFESEFAGLSFHTQCNLIKKGYSIMRNKCIYPSVWISPCHTFDLNTLRAVKTVTQIKVISDGIACYPYVKYGLNFLPQQLWWPKWMPFGIWTICLHPSNMTDAQMASFEREISGEKFKGKFIDPMEALNVKTKISWISYIYKFIFWLLWHMRYLLKNSRMFRRRY